MKMNTLLAVQKRKIGRGRRILERILLPPFRLFIFAASLILKPWLARTGRKKNAKLYRDVLSDMNWTLSNLHPDISLVGNNLAMGRFATITLRSQYYSIKITREYYYGGDDFFAQIASSCDPNKYFPIGVAARVIDSEKYAQEKKESWTLLRTLNDLDSFLCSFDPVFRDRLSSGEYENTSRAIEEYLWREWHAPNQPSRPTTR
jgi:hypothetical protein